jgi:phosphotransferase family enzyme
MPEVDLQEVLSTLEERESRGFRLLGRYAQGEFGAYRLIDCEGHYFALKLTSRRRIENAAATTRLLATIGYPAPAYVHIGPAGAGLWYAVLSELPGKPLLDVTPPLARRLVALLDLQAGQAFLPEERPSIVDSVIDGDPYNPHDALRDYSAVTAALLDEIVAIGRRNQDLAFPTIDIVHYDFHGGNMLSEDGQISGIVDWEGTRSGDRAFDVATLLFYAYENEAVRAVLWTALFELAGPHRAAVYLAHMMQRQVGWSARHHPDAAVQHYLARSANLLADLKAVG